MVDTKADGAIATAPVEKSTNNQGLEQIRDQTHGARANVQITSRGEISQASSSILNGFSLSTAPHSGENSAKPPASETTSKNLEPVRPYARPFTASSINTAVDAIHIATEVPHMFGLYHSSDMSKVMDIMRDKTPQEIKAMDATYNAKYGAPEIKGAESPMMDRFKATLSTEDYNRISRLINEKNTNDVPVAERVDGSQLVKDDAGLKVGETNHLTTPDGRKYDLYIPLTPEIHCHL